MKDLSKIRKNAWIGVVALAALLLLVWRTAVHQQAGAATPNPPATT